MSSLERFNEILTQGYHDRTSLRSLELLSFFQNWLKLRWHSNRPDLKVHKNYLTVYGRQLGSNVGRTTRIEEFSIFRDCQISLTEERALVDVSTFPKYCGALFFSNLRGYSRGKRLGMLTLNAALCYAWNHGYAEVLGYISQLQNPTMWDLITSQVVNKPNVQQRAQDEKLTFVQPEIIRKVTNKRTGSPMILVDFVVGDAEYPQTTDGEYEEAMSLLPWNSKKEQ